ncbi:uncharacterized protein DUF3883 [Tamilnaduibacter salinus]|uniref:Uncharacterized protein DUF3883 n=1 Tax=Tamilnaduibacter salinus TaxID=1484056 RepID=A0A2U1CXL3_9GAMM|nr:DUF3883 domain-containing protein [Tamilnaduibacter salinus]PVY76856.1 uncharacterized protein DUF3883 [Tamilnaduibacter salinus]
MSLLDYEQRFSALRVNSAGGNRSPHKVALLRAVMDLVESGQIQENAFYFDDRLRARFTDHFQELAGPSDRDNPHLPFFHLRSEGFWHHKERPGQRERYADQNTVTSPGALNALVDYAFLDDELFELLGNRIARELLKSAMEKNLDETAIRELIQPGRGGWDWLECEFLVADYMAMMEKHLAGVKYSKADHRRALQAYLNNRSRPSIEFKHRNISAVLLEQGLPYLPGYRPAHNYQQQLGQVVLSYLAGHQSLLDDLTQLAGGSVTEPEPSPMDWSKVYDPNPPDRIPYVAESRPSYIARRIDFSERERRNRSLGQSAESFVVQLERQRLTEEGRPDLAAEVEWSSLKRGDGLGFDIRSFDARRDEERFLEVKATHSGKYQPFFISENERAFSNDYSDAYRLYRVYEFSMSPRLFVLPGAVEQYVHLIPRSYQARF